MERILNNTTKELIVARIWSILVTDLRDEETQLYIDRSKRTLTWQPYGSNCERITLQAGRNFLCDWVESSLDCNRLYVYVGKDNQHIIVEQLDGEEWASVSELYDERLRYGEISLYIGWD